MKFSFQLAGVFAACLSLSLPVAADDSEIPMHAERFVRALQQQRFDDAAAMFKPGEKHAPAATAAQLKRIAMRIGGFPTMHNVLTLPDGTTLKLEVPSAVAPAPRPSRYFQLKYAATALDGQPVFYVLTLDGGMPPRRVLWFEVHLPTPDAASTKRAEQAVAEVSQ